MLLRFGVSNHLSIRDFQELSLVASSLKDPGEGLIPCAAAPGGFVVPAVAIYGANASGKSNFGHAMGTMRSMVRESQTRWKPDDGVPRHPFALDPACSETPSRFEIDFAVDGVRHHYGFEASDTAFESEWLYVFPKSYRRLLFARNGDEFHFGRALKGENAAISRLTRPNSLYLSAAAQNGHALLSGIFDYFTSIHGVGSVTVDGPMAAMLFAKRDLDRRTIRFLQQIDTGVTSYRRKELHIREEGGGIQEGLLDLIKKAGGERSDFAEWLSNPVVVELEHRSRDDEPVYFSLDLESAGTRRLLMMLGPAFQVLDEGNLLFIDELDASLHTRAAAAVLNLFCSPTNNPKGAQVVATTHDTNLLNAPALRRDQVWFVEKDSGGATRLYPLTDIRTRKGDDFERGYLQGRYGAAPGDMDLSALVSPR